MFKKTKKELKEKDIVSVSRKDFPRLARELGEDFIPSDELKKEDGKWDSFLSLFKFANENAHVELKESKPTESIAKNEVEEDVDGLLQIQDYLSIAELMQHGFEFNQKQKVVFTEMLSDEKGRFDDKNMDLINILIEKKFKIPDEFWQVFVSDSSFQIYTKEYLMWKQKEFLLSDKNLIPFNRRISSGVYLQIAEHVAKFYENIDNKIKVLNLCLQNVAKFPEDKGYVSLQHSILSIMDYMGEGILSEISKEKKKEITVLFKELNQRLSITSYHEHVPKIDKIIEKLESNVIVNNINLEKLIEKTQIAYSGEKDIVENTKIVAEEKLPSNIAFKIKEINRIYSSIVLNKDTLPLNQFLDIEILVKKRLPQFVNNYNTMTDDFKETLLSKKNQTSEDLLMDILSDMESVVMKANRDINITKINALNAGKEYMKKFNP